MCFVLFFLVFLGGGGKGEVGGFSGERYLGRGWVEGEGLGVWAFSWGGAWGGGVFGG